MRTWLLRIWFHTLRTLDTLFPGWSQPVEFTGDHVSAESVHYWTTAERYRRTRD